MSLLQQACDTYDNAEKDHAGVYDAGENEPLASICHAITNAKIEITIDADGNFIQGTEVNKDEAKTIFPVTEDSAGRTSTPCAHPLCEQLGYLIPQNTEKYQREPSAHLIWKDTRWFVINLLKYGMKARQFPFQTRRFPLICFA